MIVELAESFAILRGGPLNQLNRVGGHGGLYARLVEQLALHRFDNQHQRTVIGESA